VTVLQVRSVTNGAFKRPRVALFYYQFLRAKVLAIAVLSVRLSVTRVD